MWTTQGTCCASPSWNSSTATSARHQRTVERQIRAARFPAVKSLDTFDFLAIPSVNKALAMELARCEYTLRRENVIAVGNSGTGNDASLQVDVSEIVWYLVLVVPRVFDDAEIATYTLSVSER